MSTVQPRAPLTRVFVGLWDGMNFIRRLTLNLLFFGFLLLIALVVLVAMFGRGSRPAPLLERTTLVIAPEGALVEQYRTDPLMRALAESGGGGVGEVQLRDVLRALDAARRDDRIERVLLRTDRMTFSGYASMREVADAIGEVRAAGKQVVAFGEYFGQQQYLLAAQADEVYLDPEGGMMLEGLSGYRQYYREALEDKLGVDVHLFKVGEYKSAAEPYILDGASPEAKEADLYWMNDIWQRHIADIATVRGTTGAVLSPAAIPHPREEHFTVLVVDDHEDIRVPLATYLRRCGLQVATAGSAAAMHAQLAASGLVSAGGMTREAALGKLFALLAAGRIVLARSSKYHRPRGIVTAGASEPNALVTIGTGGLATASVITLFIATGAFYLLHRAHPAPPAGLSVSTSATTAREIVILSIWVAATSPACVVWPCSATTAITRHSGIFSPKRA